MRKFSLVAFALIGTASPVLAYSPQWLECTGNVTVTPTAGPATKNAVDDIYVYDPDASNLFKYSAERKSLSYLGAKAGDNGSQLKWAGSTTTIDHESWAGQFDRSTMALQLTDKSADGDRVWSEHCAPTSPKPEGQ